MGYRIGFLLIVWSFLCWTNLSVFAQSPTATVNGQVRDTMGGMVQEAEVQLINELTNVNYTARTNDEGIYSISSVPPGPYRIQVSKVGFKTIIQSNITLNVLDARAINFELSVGAVSEIVTVQGGVPLVDTESAAVSTVVDQNFAENLPMNGRSFQSLIELTPGVVLTPTNRQDTGQFSVNGQRAASNYWMVDGVGANIGMGGILPGNGLGGSLGSFSALGGTNSLVSVDAMQEFRIETSTYAPEFGRAPGGQISIVTRPGTNHFHGTAFDYLRNDVFDANDWFADSAGLPKPKERQNDFGGTLGGPISKDSTFFFISYEGLRLRLPQTTLSLVPDLASRQSANVALQPYFNAFPLPNGQDLNNGTAQFNASYTNPATLDAYSARLDHKVRNNISLFARYNYSPSSITQRGLLGSALNTASPNTVNTETITIGTTLAISSHTSNDLRVNYSRTNADSRLNLGTFGGATPLPALPLPSPFTSQNSNFFFYILSLGNTYDIAEGKLGHNLQRQINVVDNLSKQWRTHTFKVGIDFRRLLPLFDPVQYSQQVAFLDVPSAETGTLLLSETAVERPTTFLFRNVGSFVQDTWKAASRLTFTYGVRWDVDEVPHSLKGPTIPAVVGFNVTNFSQLGLAPTGTSPYATTYGNVAPRLGLAYQLSASPEWQRVIRGGIGVFYDLASSEVGNMTYDYAYPFGSAVFCPNPAVPACPANTLTFPLSPTTAAPPPVQPPTASNAGSLYGLNPHLELPFTVQGNVALEQALGISQKLSASYIVASGHRLIQTATVGSPNPNISFAQLVTNGATSSYNALQVQFERRLSHGLQGLLSYTLSHSIDTGSAGSIALPSNALLPSAIGANRGPSDFDIRNAFSAGLTFTVPKVTGNPFIVAILGGWSTQTFILARSAPPVDISDANFFQFENGFQADVRPDLVSGQSVYLYGRNYPGGRVFNPSAFTNPPTDPTTDLPLRQGNVPRNFLRAFRATQWDFALHREFHITEPVVLQFRAEMFNVLNHPNFGPPSGQFGTGTFGLSTELLGQSLASGFAGGGSLSPLYQIGGPRSIQLALKLRF